MGGTFSTTAATAAFVSTGIISLAPNLIFVLLPNYAAGDHSIWLSLGQATAAGGLMGDVFLHTLAGNVDGLWVLAGFTLFLAADLLIRTLQSDDGAAHTAYHSHSHQQNTTTNEAERRDGRTKENGTKAAPQPPKVHINRSTVILNLAADALHNFTDGLAIGATYSMTTDSSSSSSQQATMPTSSVWSLLTSHSRGGLATVSIAFHEIPHELGDVCTLIRAGYSKRQAMALQLITAIGAFCGTATAIAVSDYYETWAEERLLWITAGGFVYLACTTILPDVLSENNSGGNRRGLFRIAQLMAFCTGIAFLYAVALLEEAEHTSDGADHRHHHHHHHHHRADEGHHHHQQQKHAEL